MKNAIETLLNSYIHDNEEYILQNGGNVANHILADTEAQDQGWLWFLSDEEIDEYENADAARREGIRNEIREYINENYNYNLRSDELLEKWIVVKFPEHVEDNIRVTARSNFEKMNLCEAFGHYNKVGCYDAGCYSLDNSASSFADDLLTAIDEEFKTTYFDDHERSSFSDLAELIEIVGLNEDQKNYAEKWVSENENHTEIKGWTFWDSHNHKTVVLQSDFGEPDCEELDKEDQIKILLEMPEEFPHIEGVATSEESENYIFHFDRWATNPWWCFVEEK